MTTHAPPDNAMQKARSLVLWTLLWIAGLPAISPGVATQTITQEGFQDFFAGELSNLTLSHNGILSLGPTLTLVAELDEAIVWSVVPDGEGGLILGTGNEGKVVRISSSGEASILFEPEEVLTRSIALGPDGRLYVGTSPGGRIYRIDLSGGRPEIYFDPAEAYIWDLLFDDDGNLYVATGLSGKVYRLPAGFPEPREAVTWFESPETHITDIALGPAGELLAGSSPSGTVYRIAEAGKAVALFRSGAQEIRQIESQDDGSVLFTTFTAGKSGSGGSASSKDAAGNVTINGNPITANPLSSSGGDGKSGEDSKATAPSGLYRLRPDGFVDQLWRAPEARIYSFAALPGGGWIAGTSESGRLFRIDSPTNWSFLQQASQGGEVSRMVAGPDDGDGFWVLTSNPAAVYRLEAESNESGVHTSKPVDAGQIARWGRIEVLSRGAAPASASVRTRTGNSPEPDDTWNGWMDLHDGGATPAVASPPGRYLQVEITFTEQSEAGEPGVRRWRTFYHTVNQAPVVGEVRVVPSGFEIVTGKRGSATVSLNALFNGNGVGERPERFQLREDPTPGLITIAWQAMDPNEDELRFDLDLRPSGGEWFRLAADLERPVHVFESRGFAEGYYEARVRATDADSNAEGDALLGEGISFPFLIDSASPGLRVVSRSADTDAIRFEIEATDTLSVISQARYRLDGGETRASVPVDGLFDARTERFVIRIPHRLADESGTLHFEVSDESGRAASIPIRIGTE